MSRPDTASRAYFARKPAAFSQEAPWYLHMSHCSEKIAAFSPRKNSPAPAPHNHSGRA